MIMARNEIEELCMIPGYECFILRRLLLQGQVRWVIKGDVVGGRREIHITFTHLNNSNQEEGLKEKKRSKSHIHRERLKF